MSVKLMNFSKVPVNTYFICGGKLYKRIENFIEFAPISLGTKVIIFNVIDVDESKLESFSPDGNFEINIQE